MRPLLRAVLAVPMILATLLFGAEALASGRACTEKDLQGTWKSILNSNDPKLIEGVHRFMLMEFGQKAAMKTASSPFPFEWPAEAYSRFLSDPYNAQYFLDAEGRLTIVNSKAEPLLETLCTYVVTDLDGPGEKIDPGDVLLTNFHADGKPAYMRWLRRFPSIKRFKSSSAAASQPSGTPSPELSHQVLSPAHFEKLTYATMSPPFSINAPAGWYMAKKLDNVPGTDRVFFSKVDPTESLKNGEYGNFDFPHIVVSVDQNSERSTLSQVREKVKKSIQEANVKMVGALGDTRVNGHEGIFYIIKRPHPVNDIQMSHVLVTPKGIFQISLICNEKEMDDLRRNNFSKTLLSVNIDFAYGLSV